MLQFAVISPVVGLRKWSSLSHVHLVLPQVEGQDYFDFYKEMQARGDLLVLDNGAYEQGKSLSHDELSEAIWRWQPDVAVLPDLLMKSWRDSLQASMSFLDLSDEFEFRPKWLAVPQAEVGDLLGWWSACLHLLRERRISWLGLPRMLGTHMTKDRRTRSNYAKFIKQLRPSIKLWALGMRNGDFEELPFLEQAGVDACDSSAPVWRGWNGFDIRSSENWEKHGSPCNFSNPPPLEDICIRLIESNLALCEVKGDTSCNSSSEK
jgi:hypothetical protein